MVQQSSLRAPAGPDAPNRSDGRAGPATSNPFTLRGRAFSSPIAMAFGLMMLAVVACAIALGGLVLLAGDGRTKDRAAADVPGASVYQPLPPAWAEPPPASGEAALALATPVAPPVHEPSAAPMPAVEEEPAPELVEGIPLPPRRDLAEARPFAGVWAPEPAACSPRQNHRGFLPAVINNEGAWAGETSCVFNSAQQAGSTWRFSAVCSNARRTWKADVRLTVTGDRLVWASQRGSQTYVRCPRTGRDT